MLYNINLILAVFLVIFDPKISFPRYMFFTPKTNPSAKLPLLVFFILINFFFYSCANLKHSSSTPDIVLGIDTIINIPQKESVYRESRKRINDLLHMKLEISFDWSKAYVYGKATLRFKPYFYPTEKLELDAKGFEIKEIALISDTARSNLSYEYDKKIISIKLDRTYNRNETYDILINYIAKPNELNEKGSSAIREKKGLYFINADGQDKDKPRQIWTQGETEASSCWFPTIDSPNERMTQEIYITVDTSYTTLSNGLLQYSIVNTDGTKTDYWKQSLPAAPYLTMIALGKYAIVEDKWRDIEVNYYVEPKYEKYARSIFGNTPEMLEFFSKRLGIDYPWEKYSQIVVRDFVSGAMENTTASVYNEVLQRNSRELLDETYEGIIAHELFHQWFGDLVTCESWSNLPLNESFASYGEVLWEEYKYGSDAAGYLLQSDLNKYLAESKRKQVELIRFYYNDQEEMFDRHTYEKGGRILHMLRSYVGDSAFFDALKLYLNTNKFSSAEIHQLRLAFEEVTGEDLNWFFNQWFFKPGHPDLLISYYYNDSLKKQMLRIQQTQDLTKNPVYKLPLSVDIYSNNKIERHEIVINDSIQEFFFDVSQRPDLVNVDATKMLLCTKIDYKSITEWVFQYYNAPLYLDRLEAIQELAEADTITAEVRSTIFAALDDSFWNIRALAIEKIKKLATEDSVKQKLIFLAQKDKKSFVRAGAIRALKQYKDESLVSIYKNACLDSSYFVVEEALYALSEKSSNESLSMARLLEKERNGGILLAVADIYASHGNSAQASFFKEALKKVKNTDKYFFIQIYKDFLLKNDFETIAEGIKSIEEIARTADPWWMRYSAFKAIRDIHKYFTEKETEANTKIKPLKKKSDAESSEEVKKLEAEMANIVKYKDSVQNLIESIKKDETDKDLLLLYNTEEE